MTCVPFVFVSRSCFPSNHSFPTLPQVILDKIHALSDMCVTQFLGKQAVFDSIRCIPSSSEICALASTFRSSPPLLLRISPRPHRVTLQLTRSTQRAVRGIRRRSQSRDQNPQLKRVAAACMRSRSCSAVNCMRRECVRPCGSTCKKLLPAAAGAV